MEDVDAILALRSGGKLLVTSLGDCADGLHNAIEAAALPKSQRDPGFYIVCPQ